MQHIFCYLAFRGCPNWFGNFYIIDISKSAYFLSSLENGHYEKAREYISARKYAHDFVSNDHIPVQNCNSFGGYDWPEYMRCVSDAHFQYLHEYYVQNGLLAFAHELRKWWKEEVFAIPKEFNELAILWNKNFFCEEYVKDGKILRKGKNGLEGFSEELMSLINQHKIDENLNCYSVLRLMSSAWSKAFEQLEPYKDVAIKFLNETVGKLNHLYLQSKQFDIANLVSYLSLSLAYYRHLKRVGFQNYVLA